MSGNARAEFWYHAFTTARVAIVENMPSLTQTRLVLPVSLQELAHRLGTAREVVSRNMSRFQSHGLLRLHKREVVILDRHGLLRETETDV